MLICLPIVCLFPDVTHYIVKRVFYSSPTDVVMGLMKYKKKQQIYSGNLILTLTSFLEINQKR
jgi:hypothetical protein